MSKVHRVVVPVGGHRDALLQRIRSVLEGGRKILLVTATDTYKDLQPLLDESPSGSIMVLDLLSTHLGVVPNPRPREGVFVPSPTMLEMTAMRVEQMHRMMEGKVHVIVDSLSSLAMFNPHGAVEEFGHYLVNRLRTLDASGDLFVKDDESSAQLLRATAPYTDGEISIGELA